ncbi:MAG: NAD(P)/FAD-dependent oxidoreductase [Thermoleophilia bacterium]|nr:NAD(P)/FAD-dependent oxidoreductase [Thermoleophilia bacterium]
MHRYHPRLADGLACARATSSRWGEEQAVAPEQVRIAIVGSGFAGLGMAMRLRRAGIDDFVVLERGDDIGGTWRENTYPGCACDVSSHLYSFSFAPNPDWSHTFSPQPEILEYLRRCARDFGVTPHLRLNCELLEARWSEQDQQWLLDTSQGELRAQVLIVGMGPLNEPAIPDIEGLDTFAGPIVHTGRWRDAPDLAGKRVAVIGTGASAIQVVPGLQPDVERLTLFQRTPAWILPHRDRPTLRLERWLYRHIPITQRLVRALAYGVREVLSIGFTHEPRLLCPVQRMASQNLQDQVSDPELRQRLTPNFQIGCKRILMSDSFYPALQQPNVKLVTDRIVRIDETAIVTETGARHELDAIVLGTGFRVTDTPMASRVVGAGAARLKDVWQGSPRAYLGVSVAGFPNCFLLVGPNTGLGHNSMIFMIEAQLNYVIDALRLLRERDIAVIDVKPQAQQSFEAHLQRGMRRSVWLTGGCVSWYLDESGRISSLWPGFSWRYWLRLRRLRPSHYTAIRATRRNQQCS